MKNEGPLNDVERFKYVSMLPDVEGGFGAVRPVRKRDKHWRMKALEDGCYTEYCAINANTDAGLEEVAKYNNYVDEWKVISEKFTQDTAMVYKKWDAFNLYVDQCEKRTYHLDPTKGGHRRLGTYKADFCSPVHPEKAKIARTHMFTVKYFIDADLPPTVQGVTPKNLIATQMNIIEGDLYSNFYREQTRVKVS